MNLQPGSQVIDLDESTKKEIGNGGKDDQMVQEKSENKKEGENEIVINL